MRRVQPILTLALALLLPCLVVAVLGTSLSVVVSTVAQSSLLSGARDVTVDASGSVIVVVISGAVYRVNSFGGVALVSSTGDAYCLGITCDTTSNIAYICSGYGSVFRLSLGTMGAAASTLASGLGSLYGIASYAPNGVLYIGDSGGGRVLRVVIATGTHTAIATGLSYRSVCVSKDGVFVYATSADAVVRINTQTYAFDSISSEYYYPTGVALNGDETALIIAETLNSRIRWLDLSTGFTTTIPVSLASPWNFKWHCNAMMRCGALVADSSSTVQFIAVEPFLLRTATNTAAPSRTIVLTPSLITEPLSASTTSSRSIVASLTASASLSASPTMLGVSSSTTNQPSYTTSLSMSLSGVLWSCSMTRTLSPAAFSKTLSLSFTKSVSTTLSTTMITTLSLSSNGSFSKSCSPSFSPSLSVTSAFSNSLTFTSVSTTASSSRTHKSPSPTLTPSRTPSTSPSSGNCSYRIDLLLSPPSAYFNSSADLQLTVTMQNESTDVISTLDDLCRFLTVLDATLSAVPTTCVAVDPIPVVASTSNGHLLQWTAAPLPLAFGRVRLVAGFTAVASWDFLQQMASSNSTSTNASTTTTSVTITRITGSTQPMNATLTQGFMSVVVDGATYDTQAALALVARCATEEVNVSVVAKWPRRSVSTVTEVTTTIATIGGAAFGGDLVSAASLVLLAMLSCSTLAPDPGVSSYVMSVFFDSGAVSMVLGNVGLGLLITLLHFGIVALVALHNRISIADVSGGFLRFPSLSLRVVEFLLPGTMYSAVLSFWAPELGATPAGVFGLLAVSVTTAATGYFSARFVVPVCEYLRYDAVFSTASYPTGHRVEVLLLFPIGQWQPWEARNRYWPFMVPYVPRGVWARLVTICLALLLGAVAGAASSDAWCVVGAWAAGVAHVLAAVVLFIFRPFRLASDCLLGPLGTLVVGAACILKAVGGVDVLAMSDQMTSSVAVLQLLRTGLGFWVQWREGQWRALCEAHLTARHDSEIHAVPLVKLETDDDVELLPLTFASDANDTCDAHDAMMRDEDVSVLADDEHSLTDSQAVTSLQETSMANTAHDDTATTMLGGVEGYFLAPNIDRDL